jgi:hypothetical protein
MIHRNERRASIRGLGAINVTGTSARAAGLHGQYENGQGKGDLRAGDKRTLSSNNADEEWNLAVRELQRTLACLAGTCPEIGSRHPARSVALGRAESWTRRKMSLLNPTTAGSGLWLGRLTRAHEMPSDSGPRAAGRSGLVPRWPGGAKAPIEMMGRSLHPLLIFRFLHELSGLGGPVGQQHYSCLATPAPQPLDSRLAAHGEAIGNPPRPFLPSPVCTTSGLLHVSARISYVN